MGLFQSVRDAVTGSDSINEPSDFEDEFEGVDENDMEGLDGPDEEPEPEPDPEWETAYQFCDDVIGEVGFVDIQEFVGKAMVYRIERSPMYRDRIESGVQTMDMITQSMENIHSMQGRFDGDENNKDYNKYVEEVRAANDLIDELDRMDGKEEQIANEVITIARDAVDAMGEASNANSRSVDSSVGVVEEN